MSRKEDIDNGIWSDPDFEALGADATLLYLWSWTNPRCGMAGLYKVSERAMTESKVAADAIRAALEELADRRFCFYEDGVLFVRTRAKHLRQKTEQIAKSIRTDVAKIPASHPMREAFLKEYRDSVWLRAVLSEQSLSSVTEGSPEGHGSLDNQPNSLTLTRRSPDRLGKRQGQGKGKRPTGVGVQGEGRQLVAWSRENLPDLPADVVSQVFVRQRSTGTEPTPESVRDEIAVRWPEYVEGRAA